MVVHTLKVHYSWLSLPFHVTVRIYIFHLDVDPYNCEYSYDEEDDMKLKFTDVESEDLPSCSFGYHDSGTGSFSVSGFHKLI